MKKYHSAGILLLSIIFFLIPAGSAFSATGNTGLFLPYSAYAVGSRPDALAIGDVNGDGVSDVVMTTAYDYDPDNDYCLFVFLQDTQGNLAPPVKYRTSSTYTTKPRSVDVGDINNDGRNDVVVGEDRARIEVFLQDPDGELYRSAEYPTTNSTRVKIGDYNSDGLLDVAGIGWGTNSADVLLQNSAGLLSAPARYEVTHGGYEDLDAQDMNNDGLTDLIVMSGQGYLPNGAILKQNPSGTLSVPVYYDLPGDVLSRGVAAGDLNGDGLNDLLMTYGGNTPYAKIGVFLQNAGGALSSSLSYSAYDIPEPVEIGDLNNDGRQDVAIAHGGWNALSVFFQDDHGILQPYETYGIPYASQYNPHGMDLGDLNNDGFLDVAIADYNNGLVVLRSACGIKPELSLSRTDVYWATYEDYTARVLSVDYQLAASGTRANSVTVTGSGASNGVTLVSDLPVALGDLAPGESADLTQQYLIPAGVGTFKTTTFTAATDACSGSYYYPGPMP